MTLSFAAVAAWLDRRRVRAAVLVLLVVEIAAFAFIVAGTHGWIVPLAGPTTTDFVSFYAAGALADAGTPALAYDHAAHLAAEERVVGAGIGYQFFNYPPVYLLLCAVLARLPYLLAFLLFEAATLGLFLGVALRVLGERSATALVALFAFPIVFWNFGLGQNAFLTAALFGAATLLVDRRPFVAGLLFGVLCYKPQFGLLVPLALIAGGQWRAVAGAVCSAAALIGLSLALFGVAAWQAFVVAASGAGGMYASGRILFAGMANPFGAVRLLGLDAWLAYAVQAVFSGAAAVLVIAVWRRKLSLPVRAASLAAATLVAAPLALLYDLMLGALAAVWLFRQDGSNAAAPGEKVMLAAVYLVLVLLGYPSVAGRLHLPVFPLAAIWLLAVVVIRARREWTQPALIAETGSPRAHRDESREPAGTPSRSASPLR